MIVSKDRVMIDCGGKGRTEQHHKSACDVNNIVKRYKNTGFLDERLNNGLYGDFASVDDYHVSFNKIIDAREDFMSLPSKIRKRFDNDPAKLIAFVLDDNNREEAESLGLVPKTPPEQPQPPVEPPVEPPIEPGE